MPITAKISSIAACARNKYTATADKVLGIAADIRNRLRRVLRSSGTVAEDSIYDSETSFDENGVTNHTANDYDNEAFVTTVPRLVRKICKFWQRSEQDLRPQTSVEHQSADGIEEPSDDEMHGNFVLLEGIKLNEPGHLEEATISISKINMAIKKVREIAKKLRMPCELEATRYFTTN